MSVIFRPLNCRIISERFVPGGARPRRIGDRGDEVRIRIGSWEVDWDRDMLSRSRGRVCVCVDVGEGRFSGERGMWKSCVDGGDEAMMERCGEEECDDIGNQIRRKWCRLGDLSGEG